jgi:DNA-binding HxlR family transcriptional regulator
MDPEVNIDSQVLVVGAGPIGLALAAELEIAGIHTVVVEQLAEPDTLQKARGVGVLAAEALRRRGLGTELQTRHQSGRGDYRRDVGSNKLLSQRLKDLDADGLVERHVHAGPPVRVEYRLTEKGDALSTILLDLNRWALKWIDLPADPPNANRWPNNAN